MRKVLGKICDLTRDAARSLACAWLDASKANALPHDPKIRLDAFLKIYLADGRGQWKPSTFESHATSIRAHILPGLGQEKVCDLTVHFHAELTRDLHRELTHQRVMFGGQVWVKA